MIYGSVCSGIEAASVAWEPLGWKPSFFSEIEPFPRAVLAHRWPGVPCHGDFTTIRAGEYDAIDLLVGGTPCQSFSIAGLRGGLDDDRGNLALEYLRLAHRLRPRWLVWENVPGVLSSSDGRDFGAILGGMVELGYGFAYRVLDAQFIRVDGYARAVPQRRRRVFVVGHLGDWRRAGAVLFERESMLGHPAPRREAGQGVAGTLAAGSRSSGGYRNDADTSDNLIAAPTAPTLDASYARLQSQSGQDFNHGHSHLLVATPFTLAIRGRGDDHQLEYRQDGTANAVLTPNGGRGGIGVGAVAFDWYASQSQGMPIDEGLCPPLKTTMQPAVAWSIMPQNSGKDFKARPVEVAQPVMAGGPVGGNQGGDYIQNGWAVRRLTPRECERLQGFPDNYTLIPHRKGMAADGPRYKALGNSMAVNVMRWIGTRIQMVEAIAALEKAA